VSRAVTRAQAAHPQLQQYHRIGYLSHNRMTWLLRRSWWLARGAVGEAKHAMTRRWSQQRPRVGPIGVNACVERAVTFSSLSPLPNFTSDYKPVIGLHGMQQETETWNRGKLYSYGLSHSQAQAAKGLHHYDNSLLANTC
jgi:hypothetical protein